MPCTLHSFLLQLTNYSTNFVQQLMAHKAIKIFYHHTVDRRVAIGSPSGSHDRVRIDGTIIAAHVQWKSSLPVLDVY